MSDAPQTTRPPGTSQPAQPSHRLGGWVVLGIIAATVVVGAIAAFRVDPFGRGGSGLSERFELQTDDYSSVAPELIGYRETAGCEIPLQNPRAIAASGAGRAYVVGDQDVVVFDGEQPSGTWPVDGEPSCIGVGSDLHLHPGRVYVGSGSRIHVLQPDGTSVGTWSEGLDDKSLLTSIAVGEESVYVADAGNRVVCRFDCEGGLLGKIGQPDPERGVRGFVIPSPYFDVAVSPDGQIWVANPGARRIESYAPEGDFQRAWGTASAEVAGFFGCCNPANFAMFPDGRFVTCEKGIPRIKVYDLEGTFQTVVADPKILGQQPNMTEEIRDEHQAKVFDLAIDERGRVLVLDPSQRRLRFFEPLQREAEEQDAR